MYGLSHFTRVGFWFIDLMLCDHDDSSMMFMKFGAIKMFQSSKVQILFTGIHDILSNKSLAHYHVLSPSQCGDFIVLYGIHDTKALYSVELHEYRRVETKLPKTFSARKYLRSGCWNKIITRFWSWCGAWERSFCLLSKCFALGFMTLGNCIPICCLIVTLNFPLRLFLQFWFLLSFCILILCHI